MTEPQLLACLIVDLCGFSKLQEEDEVAAIETVYRLRRIGQREVEDRGGRLVNAFADNLFCVLPSVDLAQDAARAIDAKIPISAGIGWGWLRLDGLDIWGVQMSRASKLGEDKAKRDEILLTDVAQASTRGQGFSSTS